VTSVRKADMAEITGAEEMTGATLNLVETLFPHTWTVSLPKREPFPYSVVASEDMVTPFYIDVGFTDMGERSYVSLREAAHLVKSAQAGRLEVYTEKELKESEERSVCVNTSYTYSRDTSREFTIVEELGVGPHNILLSCESILVTTVPATQKKKTRFYF